jgi:hypothetical protein
MKEIYSPLSIKLSTSAPSGFTSENGKVLMYPKSDGWYMKDSNGIETSVSSEYKIPSDFSYYGFYDSVSKFTTNYYFGAGIIKLHSS